MRPPTTNSSVPLLYAQFFALAMVSAHHAWGLLGCWHVYTPPRLYLPFDAPTVGSFQIRWECPVTFLHLFPGDPNCCHALPSSEPIHVLSLSSSEMTHKPAPTPSSLGKYLAMLAIAVVDSLAGCFTIVERWRLQTLPGSIRVSLSSPSYRSRVSLLVRSGADPFLPLQVSLLRPSFVTRSVGVPPVLLVPSNTLCCFIGGMSSVVVWRSCVHYQVPQRNSKIDQLRILALHGPPASSSGSIVWGDRWCWVHPAWV